MKYFILLILLGSMPAAAERVTLTQTADARTNQLFSQLAQYRLAPQLTEGIKTSADATNALLGLMAPQIKQIPGYTGVFTATCSIFFNDAVEEATCNINPTESRVLYRTIESEPGSALLAGYGHQITRSNILLATVFADWRANKLQDFSTNLYFKQYTCTSSLSASLSETAEATATASVSLKDSPSASINASESATHTISADASQSTSQSSSHSQSSNPSPSSTFSESLSGIFSATHSLLASLSRSFSHTFSPSPGETLSASRSHTESQTDTDTHSHTPSVSPVPSLSHSQSATESKSTSLSENVSTSESSTADSSISSSFSPIFSGSERALWSRTTGVYDDTTSQAGRFTLNGSVVTDSFTGLQWQSATSAGTHNWSASAAPSSAQEYCTQQSTGGFNDWRVPTRIELGTLIEYGASNPSINTGKFPGTPLNYFWTKTAYGPDPTNAWTLVFSNGITDPAALGNTYYIRCVRSGNIPISQGYTDETGATLIGGSTQVKDTATGLIWERGISPTTHTRASASSYCSGLTLGGQSWRLPTVRELSTLMDLSKTSAPTIDTSAFPSMPTNFLWSSTPYQPDPSNMGWNAYFNTGNLVQNSLTATDYVRCVR